MRCVRCRRLLQKVEENALRPGKRLEIKCGHCKVMNYLTGTDPDVEDVTRTSPDQTTTRSNTPPNLTKP
jgi:phage FluMu protein Com